MDTIGIPLPSSSIEYMRVAIRNTADYKKRELIKTDFVKKRMYMQAKIAADKLKEYEDEVLKEWINNYSIEYRKVSDLIKDMKEEDRDMMNIYGNMMVMICDVLETTSIEMDQLLKKYHPNFRVESFDKVKALGKEAHEKVKMLVDYKEDEFYTNTYGTCADNLFELTCNKVKSFIGKIKKREESMKKKSKQ